MRILCWRCCWVCGRKKAVDTMPAGGQTLGATGFDGGGAVFFTAHWARSGAVTWQASNAIFAVNF